MDKNFKPYIPADKVTTEMTPASVILGIVLAILTVAGVTDKIDVSSYLPAGNITSLIVLIAVSAVVFFMSGNGKKITGKKKNAK